jgi:hypothetical protein
LIASNDRQCTCQRMATECGPAKEKQKCGSCGRARSTAMAYPYGPDLAPGRIAIEQV